MPVHKVVFGLRGSITRREYWLRGWLVYLIASLTITMLFALIPWPGNDVILLNGIWLIAHVIFTIWVFLALATKRLRDMGKNSWGAVWLLVLFFFPVIGFGVIIALGSTPGACKSLEH